MIQEYKDMDLMQEKEQWKGKWVEKIAQSLLKCSVLHNNSWTLSKMSIPMEKISTHPLLRELKKR